MLLLMVMMLLYNNQPVLDVWVVAERCKLPRHENAGAAPGGVEIDEDWQFRVLNHIVHALELRCMVWDSGFERFVGSFA